MNTDATTMPSDTLSKPRRWTARSMKGLVILFMLFDGITKLLQVAPVLDACARLGLPLGTIPIIGTIALGCTLLYAIPRTAILGAVLLTGFFGGAIAIQLRAGMTVFETVFFPLLMAVLTWGAPVLTEPRLRAIFPVRK